MLAPEAIQPIRLQSIRRSPAQARVLAAALELFADHGVSGTSLQMIADRVGVSKAAVYRQFKSKNEIVLAVAETEFAKLEAALETAEAHKSAKRVRQMLLAQVIEMAVKRRRWVRALQNDPVMVNLLAHHQPLQNIMGRVYGLLIGDPGDKAKIKIAIMGSAIGATVIHPLVAGMDDETLQNELMDEARRLFDISD